MNISKNIYKKTLWILLACFVAYTLYFLWEQSQPKPDVYELLTPQQRNIQKTCVATGSIESRKQIDVKPRATGSIKQLCVTIGQQVKAGQTIAIIEIIPDMSVLSQTKSDMETTRLKLEESQLEANRTSALYKKGVVSREEYEKMMSQLAIDKEAHFKAKCAYDVALTGSSARSGNVNTTLVKASMDGTIVGLPLKEGASVVATNAYNEGTTIATIADLSVLRFAGKIDETEVEHLHVGMPMKITIGAAAGTHYAGTIEEVASGSTLDNGTVMYEIKGSVKPTEGVKAITRSGYSANAEIVTAQSDNVLSVEEAAIEFRGDSTFVYRLQQDGSKRQTFDRIPVTVGLSDGIHIEIKSGVQKGDVLRGNKIEE